jgi:hypothetical protein
MPDPKLDRRVLERIEVVLHQAGPNQEGFVGFFEKELKPRLAKL